MASALIKRTWTKIDNNNSLANHHTGEYHDLLEIWDGGSIRYERITTAECQIDKSWEVLERTYIDNEHFTELLKELPPWMTPAHPIFQEQLPLLLLGIPALQVPGWSVTQEVLPVVQRTLHSYNTIDTNSSSNVKKGQKAQHSAPKVKRPFQGHPRPPSSRDLLSPGTQDRPLL